MKRLFLLSAIALVAICSSSCGSSPIGTPTKPEAPERQGWKANSPLYGDVELVVMTEYKLEDKFGEVVRGGILDCRKYYFNDAGDVIEEAGYNSDGSLSYKWIYKYDSSGNKIEEAWYDSDGSLFVKYIYKYDSTGNMIESAVYESDGSLGSKWIYKHDSSGNVIEATGYRGEALIPELLIVLEITYRN